MAKDSAIVLRVTRLVNRRLNEKIILLHDQKSAALAVPLRLSVQVEMLISSWQFSRLSLQETCRYRAEINRPISRNMVLLESIRIDDHTMVVIKRRHNNVIKDQKFHKSVVISLQSVFRLRLDRGSSNSSPKSSAGNPSGGG